LGGRSSCQGSPADHVLRRLELSGYLARPVTRFYYLGRRRSSQHRRDEEETRRGRPARGRMHHITCSPRGGSYNTFEVHVSPYKKTYRLSYHRHQLHSHAHLSCHRQYPSRHMPGLLSRHLFRHPFFISTATYPSHNAESRPLQPTISQSSRQTLSPRMGPTTGDKGNSQLREAEVH
jgi:hypothetical protein